MDVNKGDFVDGSAIANAMVNGATGEALSPITLRNSISVPLSDSLTAINGYRLIWVNPNPDNAFPGGILDIDVSDFKFLVIVNRWRLTNNELHTHTLIADVDSLKSGWIAVEDVPGWTAIYRRNFKLADDMTRLSVSICTSFTPWDEESAVTANQCIIPLRIYGIK